MYNVTTELDVKEIEKNKPDTYRVGRIRRYN